MASDAELVERLREFLRTSDLATTTTAIVRRRLEEDFGVNLSDKKAFIREQVDLFLRELEDDKEADDQAETQVEAVKEEDEEKGRDGPGEEEDEEQEEEEEGGSVEVSDEEDEEEDEDEKKGNGGSSKKRKSSKLNMEVKKRGGGFTKLCSLSPLLQEFLGESELARTEVVKRLWAYIREKNLQDPSNRRKIICDERLQPLFNVNIIDMFQMNKALSKHIWPLDSESAGSATPVKAKQNSKKPKKEKEKEGKRQKGGSSGLLMPLPLSDDLVKFFGTGETTLSRSGVVKKMWDYIKQNELQDPADRRNVICDEKLKELFKVDSFRGFSVSKLLAPHFIKANQMQSGLEFSSIHLILRVLMFRPSCNVEPVRGTGTQNLAILAQPLIE
ncbi:upstream activation factor subunit spp27 isoform X1 [Canna indica]|uniref:Upstream activation factor subunit spp27 isoform X1 n=1 Tax=Canna indica TaxID=4628 RepID=A0AAQ3L9H4_9LILI|nr:upstream activation factor subunit spp27 isoform X1 [Canna indica]